MLRQNPYHALLTLLLSASVSLTGCVTADNKDTAKASSYSQDPNESCTESKVLLSSGEEILCTSPLKRLNLFLSEGDCMAIAASVFGESTDTVKVTNVYNVAKIQQRKEVDFSNVLGAAAMIGSLAFTPLFGCDPFEHFWRNGLAQMGLQQAGDSLAGGSSGLTKIRTKRIPIGPKTETVEEDRKAYQPLEGIPIRFDCGPLGQFIRVTDEKGEASLNMEPIRSSLEEPLSITVTANVGHLSDTKSIVVAPGK